MPRRAIYPSDVPEVDDLHRMVFLFLLGEETDDSSEGLKEVRKILGIPRFNDLIASVASGGRKIEDLL